MLSASVIALWIMMVFVLVLTLLIYKQVGELVMGSSPRQDPNEQGPEVGSDVPRIFAYDLQTSEAVDYAPRNELLVFAMPGCPGCEQIAEQLPEFAASHPTPSITFVTVFSERDLEAVENEVRRVGELVLPEAIRSPESRRDIRILAGPSSAEKGPHETYGITGTPFALLVDENGKVGAKAALRAEFHLERLVESSNGNRLATDVVT